MRRSHMRHYIPSDARSVGWSYSGLAGGRSDGRASGRADGRSVGWSVGRSKVQSIVQAAAVPRFEHRARAVCRAFWSAPDACGRPVRVDADACARGELSAGSRVFDARVRRKIQCGKKDAVLLDVDHQRLLIRIYLRASRARR